ncbi:reverse transcriptase [Saccharopolyspora erythraea D]|nr:reverse transcriptase [Saccharopolyspora erythraea D]
MVIWQDVALRALAETAVNADAWEQSELAAALLRHFRRDGGASDAFAWTLLAHVPEPPESAEELLALLVAVPELTAALPKAPRPALEVELSPGWRWPVARWHTAEQLAHGLDLDVGELMWFADRGGWLRHAHPPLRHYRCRWMRTRSGGIRLIEQPKARLAELQRRITRRVVDAMPVHEAAHGFRRGRSAATCAAEHAGRHFLVRVDVEGFFASLTFTRISRAMRAAGYPGAVAGAIGGLLTTATPRDVLAAAPRVRESEVDARRRLLGRLAAAHVPQGAPSSPALANALMHRLDRRIDAYAGTLGATYTRYADDLAFSGDRRLPVAALLRGVTAIVRAEGLRLRQSKTRVLAPHQRQRIAGLVVNDGRAVAPRAEYDALRALLHNCARTGPQAQNHEAHPDFRSHLLGRIAWVGINHPGRARKLGELFDRINW